MYNSVKWPPLPIKRHIHWLQLIFKWAHLNYHYLQQLLVPHSTIYWSGATIWLSLKLKLKICWKIPHIPKLRVSQMVVPNRWKTSCLDPVPKKKNPNTHSDYRPVVLRSHVMKSQKRLILRHLRTVVSSALNPLQFAYHIWYHRE